MTMTSRNQPVMLDEDVRGGCGTAGCGDAVVWDAVRHGSIRGRWGFRESARRRREWLAHGRGWTRYCIYGMSVRMDPTDAGPASRGRGRAVWRRTVYRSAAGNRSARADLRQWIRAQVYGDASDPNGRGEAGKAVPAARRALHEVTACHGVRRPHTQPTGSLSSPTPGLTESMTRPGTHLVRHQPVRPLPRRVVLVPDPKRLARSRDQYARAPPLAEALLAAPIVIAAAVRAAAVASPGGAAVERVAARHRVGRRRASLRNALCGAANVGRGRGGGW
jgi:hypothetical protein